MDNGKFVESKETHTCSDRNVNHIALDQAERLVIRLSHETNEKFTNIIANVKKWYFEKNSIY